MTARVLLIFLLVFCICGLAAADTIDDPIVQLFSGTPNSGTAAGTFGAGITTLTTTVSPSQSDGTITYFNFTNNSGATFSSLDVTTTQVKPPNTDSGFSCPVAQKPAGWTCTMSYVDTATDITATWHFVNVSGADLADAGSQFQLGLMNGNSNPPNTGNQWFDSSTTLTLTANVPEPASLTLLASGIAAIAMRRRRK